MPEDARTITNRVLSGKPAQKKERLSLSKKDWAIIGTAAAGGSIHGLIRGRRAAAKKLGKKVPILGMIYTGADRRKE